MRASVLLRGRLSEVAKNRNMNDFPAFSSISAALENSLEEDDAIGRRK